MASEQNNTPSWEKAIEWVSSLSVKIEFYSPRAFEQDDAICSEGTGFMVNTKKGFILTNHHIVVGGILKARVTFFKSFHEFRAKAVYSSEDEDFAYLQIEDEDFERFQQKMGHLPPLELHPEDAKVGVKIKQIGNDAGRDMSIFSGDISQIFPNAPFYGDLHRYFMTFFIQTSMPTSGGSSGSPIFDKYGHVLGIQSGGGNSDAATLVQPVGSAARVLKLLEEGKTPRTGTIHASFQIEKFQQCTDKGMPDEITEEMRTHATEDGPPGFLMVSDVIPDGLSHNKIRIGDMLVSVNDELLNDFVELRSILDSSIGGYVKLALKRGSATIIEEIDVSDIADFSPKQTLTVCGGVFQEMPYKASLHGHLQTNKFVCVTRFGGCWPTPFASRYNVDQILRSIYYNGKKFEIQKLDDLIECMSQIPNRADFSATFGLVLNKSANCTLTINNNRDLYPTMTLMSRGEGMKWIEESVGNVTPALLPKNYKDDKIAAYRLNKRYNHLAGLSRSIVQTLTTKSYLIDGANGSSLSSAHGVILDADKGIIFVPYNGIESDWSTIQVTIGESVKIDAEVIFIHPTDCYCLVKYDPALAPSQVRAVELSDENIEIGDETTFVGYSGNSITVAEADISGIATAGVVQNCGIPTMRLSNYTTFFSSCTQVPFTNGGLFVDEESKVKGLVVSNPILNKDLGGSASVGMDVAGIKPVLDLAINDNLDKFRQCAFLFQMVELSSIIHLNIPAEWQERIKEVCNSTPLVPRVYKIFAGIKSEMQVDDIILSVNGKTVSGSIDLQRHDGSDSVELVVFRNGELVTRTEEVHPLSTFQSKEVVFFAGAILQDPHFSVYRDAVEIPSRIFIEDLLAGSPASFDKLPHSVFITEVNNRPVKTLDELVEQVKDIPETQPLSITIAKSVSKMNDIQVISIRQDNKFYPLKRFVRTPNNKGLKWAAKK